MKWWALAGCLVGAGLWHLAGARPWVWTWGLGVWAGLLMTGRLGGRATLTEGLKAALGAGGLTAVGWLVARAVV